MRGTLDQLLLDAGEAEDRIALRTREGDVSFSQLALRIRSIAADLHRSASVRPERIGLLLPNTAGFAAALFGVLRSGGSALLLNPPNSLREMAEQIADARATRVITTASLRDRLPAGVDCLMIDELGTGGAGTEVPAGRGTGWDPQPPPPDLDREAVVIFTSAMEGRARGAALSHRNLVANLRSTVEAMEMGPEDRVLAALPFAHAFGLTVCLNAPLAAGATVLPMPKFNPLAVLERLDRERVTLIAGVPAMFIALLSAAAKVGVPAHAMRLAICGGAPLPLEVARRWEEVFGIPLRQGYGLTEASPVCLLNPPARPNRVGTLGFPYPGVELSIRDPQGEELEDGEVGELCVRGENVFAGYLDGRDMSVHFFGDWLRTGDLASREQQAIRFRGTLKAMFTRNGFNVYPEEIRRVLAADERIDDVLVCARPDAGRENEIVLQIRVRSGASLAEAEVRELCRTALAAYKQPSRIFITRDS
jgi:long-chain acyl-CoA synthetase